MHLIPGVLLKRSSSVFQNRLAKFPKFQEPVGIDKITLGFHCQKQKILNQKN